MPASSGRVDIYSGVVRAHGKLWATIVRPQGDQREPAVVLIHPTSNFMGHYAQEPLARRGVAAVGMATRYMGNDTALIMETACSTSARNAGRGPAGPDPGQRPAG